MTPKTLDVIVIGGGFSGILAVHKLRRIGLQVHGFERQERIGGVWRENAYPIAAVDSPFPYYQFYDEDLLRDWQWREQYPTRAEMLRYFDHVDDRWHISVNFDFGVSVSGASYSEGTQKWTVALEDGRIFESQWLVPAVGFSSVLNSPPFPGIERFHGPVYHTARWPRDAVDMSGKKVAVVGTGPSGVQIIQAVGKVAKSMTIYQQSPCLTLRKYSTPDQTIERLNAGPDDHREALQLGMQSYTGCHYALRDQDALTLPAEERNAFYRKQYLEGGWAFWMGGFRDMCQDLQANQDAYAWWAEQTRTRIKDPTKQKLLVPDVPPMPFGIKRPCLEEDLYEVMDQAHVEIVDISGEPIEAITEEGVRACGRTIDFDAIILATGFSDEASGLKSLNISGRNGLPLQKAWSESVQSHLGIAINQFPNMFFLYGPQCPTLLVNSPAVITVQVDWICEIISGCRRKGISMLEATREAHFAWEQKMGDLWVKTLYYKQPHLDPQKVRKAGKRSKKEQTWIGGLQLYRDELDACLADGLQGFQSYSPQQLQAP